MVSNVYLPGFFPAINGKGKTLVAHYVKVIKTT